MIERTLGEQPRALVTERTPLLGGLESAAVERIVARYRDERGRARVYTFVAKHVRGAGLREAAVYERLLARAGATEIAPRLLGVEMHGTDTSTATLYLEAVNRARAWPWAPVHSSRLVLEQLAHFHEATRTSHGAVSDWDYGSTLERSAGQTVDLLDSLRGHPELSGLAQRGFRSARRFALGLPRLRAELLRFHELSGAPIHGDLHSGNVILRRRTAHEAPVFIDWGRARIGSPLEDVSSWLHSIGYLEPEPRRRHDTLLRAYLHARGLDERLTSTFRAAYWVASAFNALAGALRYHLAVALSAEHAHARVDAAAAARNWVRVVCRAQAHAC